MLLCLVVAAGNATVAAVVAGTARTVTVTAALAILGITTRTATETTAVVVRGAVAGTGGSLGLIETVERNLAALVNLDNLDLHLIADVELMCKRPSLEGVSETKAPNGWMETTRPQNSSPTSGSCTMSLMRSMASSTEVPTPPT